MIPKEAFAAIAAVMVVSCAFGYVLRGIGEKNRKTDSEWFLNGLSADHDRWEDDPEPTRNRQDDIIHDCYTCKYAEETTGDEPCDSCITYTKWERMK